MRQQYPVELRELSWSVVYSRPDLQMRTIVLMMRDLYNFFEPLSYNSIHAYAFADAAYNGGQGGVNRERRACNISADCDPSKWFDHVEKYCLKSRAVLYGKRSACDINRHHVQDVMHIRSNKYKPFF